MQNLSGCLFLVKENKVFGRGRWRGERRLFSFFHKTSLIKVEVSVGSIFFPALWYPSQLSFHYFFKINIFMSCLSPQYAREELVILLLFKAKFYHGCIKYPFRKKKYITCIISNLISEVILFHSLQFERIQKLNFELFKMWNRPFFLKDCAVFVVGYYIKPQTHSHPQIKKLYINLYPVLFHIPVIWPETIASGRLRVKESF